MIAGWMHRMTFAPSGEFVFFGHDVEMAACVECGLVSTFLGESSRLQLAARFKKQIESADSTRSDLQSS